MEEAVSRKKDVHKATCLTRTWQNKRYRALKNKSKKAVSKQQEREG